MKTPYLFDVCQRRSEMGGCDPDKEVTSVPYFKNKSERTYRGVQVCEMKILGNANDRPACVLPASSSHASRWPITGSCKPSCRTASWSMMMAVESETKSREKFLPADKAISIVGIKS